MNKCPTYIKDPEDVLDYQVDWTLWLKSGDVLVDSDWSAPGGISIDSSQFDDTTATVWLSGGSIGITYHVVNHIVTDAGREKDRTIRVKIKQQ